MRQLPPLVTTVHRKRYDYAICHTNFWSLRCTYFTVGDEVLKITFGNVRMKWGVVTWGNISSRKFKQTNQIFWGQNEVFSRLLKKKRLLQPLETVEGNISFIPFERLQDQKMQNVLKIFVPVDFFYFSIFMFAKKIWHSLYTTTGDLSHGGVLNF